MSAGLSNNREVKLIRHVQGEIHPEDFAIMETTIPAPGPYEAVVRNRWFRVSISTRLMAQEDAKAAEGIPFPPQPRRHSGGRRDRRSGPDRIGLQPSCR